MQFIRKSTESKEINTSRLKSIDASFVLKLPFSHNQTPLDHLNSGSYRLVHIVGHDNRRHPTMREAIELIASEIFVTSFLKSRRAFVICVVCEGPLLPLNAAQLTQLNCFKDRPMLFFFESGGGGEFCAYYRDDGALRCLTDVARVSLDEFCTSRFSFELLLSALRSNLGGWFSGRLLDTRLSCATVEDKWRLISLAVWDSNVLCIRFLMLFENFLATFDNMSVSLLQNAVQLCNYEGLLALFDQGFEEPNIELKIDRNLLAVRAENGYNLLMIAVMAKNVDATRFLLNLNFFDVNEAAGRSTTAATLACNTSKSSINYAFSGCEKAHFPHRRQKPNASSPAKDPLEHIRAKSSSILLMLLQNDSKHPPPNSHDLSSRELEMFREKVDEFHRAIVADDKRGARNFMCSLKLRFYFNEQNKSAALTAVEHRRFSIYELLLINRSALAPHEDFASLELDADDRRRLKALHDRYKSPLYEKCVLEVEKRMHAINVSDALRQRLQFELSHALTRLYDVDEFRPVLRIVAAASIKFLLDFDRSSVHVLDPSECSSTRGYYANGTIYIGCRELLERDRVNFFLATLIHEMTHFVVDFLYENYCRPFVAGDAKRERDFREVVDCCRRNTHGEKIVDAVFAYDESLHYSELIVRPNHLIAHYCDDEERLRECRANFPELFAFYRERIHGDMLNRLESIEDGEDHVESAWSRKRKYAYSVHKDVRANDGETEILIDSATCEANEKPKPVNFGKFLLIFAAFFAVLTIFCVLALSFTQKTDFTQNIHVNHTNQLIALQSGQSLAYAQRFSATELPLLSQTATELCGNTDHPQIDLLTEKNTHKLELTVESLKGSKDALRNFWLASESCNFLTLAVDRSQGDAQFVEDVMNVAEDAFEGCENVFGALLVSTMKRLEEAKCECEGAQNVLKAKLREVLKERSLVDYLKGSLTFEEKCQ